MSYELTTQYYPQRGGKLERYCKPIKAARIQSKVAFPRKNARNQIPEYITILQR